MENPIHLLITMLMYDVHFASISVNGYRLMWNNPLQCWQVDGSVTQSDNYQRRFTAFEDALMDLSEMSKMAQLQKWGD